MSYCTTIKLELSPEVDDIDLVDIIEELSDVAIAYADGGNSFITHEGTENSTIVEVNIFRPNPLTNELAAELLEFLMEMGSTDNYDIEINLSTEDNEDLSEDRILH